MTSDARTIRLDADTRLDERLRGGVVALGNFDGFHLGHQAVVGAAVARARALGVPALVATFDPHPVRLFRPDAPPFRLTSLDQRAQLFGQAGADATVILTFDAALSGLSAEAFIAERLSRQIGAVTVVTGEDFIFGKGRGGSATMLAQAGPARGMDAIGVAPVCLDGEAVSSSRIRQALMKGDCAGATRLLTRPYCISGTVIHGDKRGRTLGFPTVNLDLGDWQHPAFGVYAVTARLDDGRTVAGVASLGIRPTFDPPREGLETFLFDFDEDLYGRTLSIAFHHHLRGEAKFATVDALVTQMHADAAQARALMGHPPTGNVRQGE